MPSSQDALHDLLGGLAGDGAAAVGAVGRADGGVEQAQVVVDLGDGADGGAGAAAGGFLLDGDGGREAFDGVDVGALDLVEELARVGGEGFDVAALAFGVDGVEGERAFAGAGEAGDDGEGVARDAHVDVAQIVLARPAHRDVSDRHDEANEGAVGDSERCGRPIAGFCNPLGVFYWQQKQGSTHEGFLRESQGRF